MIFLKSIICFGILSYIIIVCLIYVFLIPESTGNGKSLRTNQQIQQSQQNLIDSTTLDSIDWKTELFWSPVEIIGENSGDPIVKLCRLDWRIHFESPHQTPQFEELVKVSKCYGTNSQRRRLSLLLSEMENESRDAKFLPSKRNVKPTGFIFHEARVGSTLVSNLLATDPFTMVFSEADPIAKAVSGCKECSRSEHIRYVQQVVYLMCATTYHKQVFFKLRSMSNTILLEAFPDVKWIYIFRSPVEVMMSNLHGKHSIRVAPCLYSKAIKRKEVINIMHERLPANLQYTNEGWCAAHLFMLNKHALDCYANSSQKTGLFVDYASLPESVPNIIWPFFKGSGPPSQLLTRMEKESKYYAKTTTTHPAIIQLILTWIYGEDSMSTFVKDSSMKQKAATDKIKEVCSALLDKQYYELHELSNQQLQQNRK